MKRLVDSAELAQLLGGLFEQLVNRWADRYEDFPAPAQYAGRSKLWWLPDVVEWLREHRPELVDRVLESPGFSRGEDVNNRRTPPGWSAGD